MGSLDLDTKLTGGDGRYDVSISPDWKIWGPNGGYMAALALRAAATASRFARPASFACHFLSVGAFEPARIAVTPLRSARTAESLRATIEQNDRVLLDAQVWTAADGAGLEHDFAPMPDVKLPSQLDPFEKLEGFERRLDLPVLGQPRRSPDRLGSAGAVDNPARRSSAAGTASAPTRASTSPRLDAARALILIDTLSWPAACRAHDESENPWMAPSLDLVARFHRAPPYSEWLLVEARADVATEGLIGFHNRVWDEAGRAIASGGGQLLCRPRPPAA